MKSAECLSILSERAALPPDPVAVYLAGSLVRGWGNEKSDLDVYVIVPTQWTGDQVSQARVWVRPGFVPVQAFYVGERRWDVEYWTDSQVDELIDYVGWDRFEAGASTASVLTNTEIAFARGLGYCKPVDGADWIGRRREQIANSAIKSLVAANLLDRLDAFTEDAVGLLAAGEEASAVLAARYAFTSAVDALMARRGEFDSQGKWRARRVATVAAREVPFQEYWAVESMRDYDPAHPETWIHDVLRRCQQIAEVIEL